MGVCHRGLPCVKNKCVVPRVSMTIQKWGHYGVIDPLLKGHRDSRYLRTVLCFVSGAKRPSFVGHRAWVALSSAALRKVSPPACLWQVRPGFGQDCFKHLAPKEKRQFSFWSLKDSSLAGVTEWSAGAWAFDKLMLRSRPTRSQGPVR